MMLLEQLYTNVIIVPIYDSLTASNRMYVSAEESPAFKPIFQIQTETSDASFDEIMPEDTESGRMTLKTANLTSYLDSL